MPPKRMRKPPLPRHGTGLSALDGVRYYFTWLGAGTPGTGAGRDRADPPGHDGLACHGRRISPTVFSIAARRSIWSYRAARGRTDGAHRSINPCRDELGNAITCQSYIASRVNSSYNSLQTTTPKPKPASITPLTSPATNKPSPSNYELLLAWLDSGSSKANARKPMTSWHQSTIGSPKGLTPRTCRRPRHC